MAKLSETWKKLPDEWRFALLAFIMARILLSLWSLVLYSLFPVSLQNMDLFGEPVLTAFDLRTSERHIFSRQMDGTVLTFRALDRGHIADNQTGSIWSLQDGTALQGKYAGRTLAKASHSVEEIFPYQGVTPETNLLLSVWQRFDTNWYLAIAEHGYSTNGSSAFFPLYPILIRGLGFPLGNNMLAALVISNLAFFGVLVLLYRQTQHFSDASTRRTIIYLILFPVGFFLLMAYTESIFFFFILAAFELAQNRKWFLASLIGILTALVRLQGVLVFIPLAYLWLQEIRLSQVPRKKAIFNGLMILVIPFVSAAFVIGSKRSFFGILESQWQSRFAMPWQVLFSAVDWFAQGKASLVDGLNLAAVLFVGIMVIAVWRRLPREYGVYMAALWVVPLVRLSPTQPFVSAIRYLLPCFPMFMILGDWGKNPWVNRAILYTSVLLQLYLSAQFILWGWVA